MALIVQKYGGTSVGDLDRIRNVARRVAKTYDQGNQVVVILSAMSGVTDSLIQTAQQITDFPDKREMDVLLATGRANHRGPDGHDPEIHGIQGKIPARIPGGNSYGQPILRRRILDIKATRLKELLADNYIVIVAGFQGCDADGDITTLGRGGSDTSAVAVASASGRINCEIYTDVDGVYTADPNICKKARKLDRISYEEMLEMASLGAKVLQIRSVEFAMKYNVPIHVRSSFNEEVGTMVVNEDANMEKVVVFRGHP
ncbi:MAG: aspartate kinase [Desulfobacterales bacterium]